MRYPCRISYRMIYPSCRISCKDILNHFLQDILQDIPSAAGKFQLGTRCSPVALHPAYRSHLRPGFCALNEAGGFSKRVSIPHSQGQVRQERPALAPQRRRRGARAAQQRRTARWHRTVPVKGGWEGVGEGGR